MDVMILGHNGMLGHMVAKYLKDQNINIKTTSHKYPSSEFEQDVLSFNGDYIINCIGSIPQKTKNFSVNYDLPLWLSNNAKVKVVHPGTDCEIDDDEYGISKRKARDYILENSINTKIIKASIIGPELTSKSSLLEWFLNSDGSVSGYTKAMWNGITTYEWAKQCLKLMNDWEGHSKETIVSSECVSKYELLEIISSVFKKQIIISPVELGVFKCLIPNIKASDIKTQLEELKEFYYGG